MSFKKKFKQTGSALLTAIGIITLLMVVSVAFLSRSVNFLSIMGIGVDKTSTQYTAEAAYQIAMAKLERGIEEFTLDSRLTFLNGGPTSIGFDDLSETYAGSLDNALTFLRHAVESQAYDSGGTVD